MSEFHFRSGQEMLDEILNGTDLYSPELNIYAFLYNNLGSIAYYHITEDDARKLERKSRESGEYWGAFLGPGGYICEDTSHPFYTPDLYSNIDFCNRYYSGKWTSTSDMGCPFCNPDAGDFTITESDYTELGGCMLPDGRLAIGASGDDGTPWYFPKFCPECGRKMPVTE